MIFAANQLKFTINEIKSQNWHKLDQKWTKVELKWAKKVQNEPKLTHIVIKVEQKWTKSVIKMNLTIGSNISTQVQKIFKMDSKQTLNGLKLKQEWKQEPSMASEMNPKWTQNGPKVKK